MERPRTYSLHVIRQKDGTYEIANQDVITLDAMLISTSSLDKTERQ